MAIRRVFSRLWDRLTRRDPADFGLPRPGRDHPNVEEWMQYPLNPDAHADHQTAPTAAYYDRLDEPGRYRVCYCYNCSSHYRRIERRDDE